MKKFATAGAATVVVASLAFVCGAALAGGHAHKGRVAATATAGAGGKVYVCHATGSASSPYVLIHVDASTVLAQGDILLGASPGSCPTAQTAVGATASVRAHAQATAAAQPTTTTTEGQGKVYICHATGSASNPFVLIHVSTNALPAHRSHQNGRDIVLGAKAGSCPTSSARVAGAATATAQPTTTTTEGQGKVYICHATGSASNPFVLIHVSTNALPAHRSHQNGRDVVLGSKPGSCPTSTVAAAAAATTAPATTTTQATTAQATTARATTTAAAAATSPASTTPGAVLGATAKVSKAHPSGGVAGAVTSGTLPFTGLRLWIVELVALGLIALGVATRLLARSKP